MISVNTLLRLSILLPVIWLGYLGYLWQYSESVPYSIFIQGICAAMLLLDLILYNLIHGRNSGKNKIASILLVLASLFVLSIAFLPTIIFQVWPFALSAQLFYLFWIGRTVIQGSKSKISLIDLIIVGTLSLIVYLLFTESNNATAYLIGSISIILILSLGIYSILRGK